MIVDFNDTQIRKEHMEGKVTLDKVFKLAKEEEEGEEGEEGEEESEEEEELKEEVVPSQTYDLVQPYTLPSAPSRQD